MYFVLLKCVFFISAINICDSSLKFSSLDKVYQKGLDAYSKERWSECIVQFEDALHLYSLYKGVIINCRIKCKSETPKATVEDIDDLRIFEFYFNARQCLTYCQRQGFEDVHMFNNVSDKILEYMQLKRPYTYLHICYFQKNDMPKAASAAYTFLVANPDDEDMKKNVDYYVQQPEVDEKEVVDMEKDEYKVLYQLGVQAYKENKWAQSIHNMEESINHFLSWENSCRAECERQPEQEWSPEFAITMSNNLASVLTCRHKCQDALKPLYESGVEMLGDVLNYLQISYYHIDQIENAAKAVATYLTLYPNDPDMLDNKGIYQTLTDKKNFEDRSDIVHYFKRNIYEKQLLDYFHNGDVSDNKANTI